MALNFPVGEAIQLALQKKRMQNEQFDQAQNMGASLGGGIGDIISNAHQKELTAQLVKAMQSNGMQPQGPMMPPPMIQGPQGYMPQGAGPNAVPAGQFPPAPQKLPPIDNTALINSLRTQLDPQAANKAYFESQDPLRQSEIDKNRASAKHLNSMGTLPGSTSSVWRNSATGETTDQPPTDPAGWVEYKVKPGQALQTLTNKGFRDNIASLTWDKFTPGEQLFAKNIYEGNTDLKNIGPREKTRYAYAANLYAEATGNPPFQSFGAATKAGVAKAFTSGKQGANVNALNTALGHLDTLKNVYSTLGNTDARLMNVPLNKLRQNANDPQIMKAITALNAVKGEAANVFKGTGATDQEIASWDKVFNENLTPAQMMGVIQTTGTLFNSRLNALQYQRDQGMGSRPGSGALLSPHAATLDKEMSAPVTEDGWVYTPGLGGKGNKANWKKQ